MKHDYLLATAAAAFLFTTAPALSGPNDFFGGSIPPAAGGDPLSGGGMPAPAMPPGADYSDDEKRMQKKYKASVSHAKELIAKGDRMIKEGQTKQIDKIYKKGKIIKEIGEKRLAELQANNPLPELPPPKAGKNKENQGQ